MSKEISEINWDDVLNEFTSCEGTIVNFFKEHGVSQHQLYYRRKKLQKETKTTFYEFRLDDDCLKKAVIVNENKIYYNDIKIEIGKAWLFILAKIDKTNKEQMLELMATSSKLQNEYGG